MINKNSGFLLLALFVLPANSQDVPMPTDKQVNYSPYPAETFPNVFFGDTHLHTSYSTDAGMLGAIGPEEAYRFARGEEVDFQHGLAGELQRPLDFSGRRRSCREPWAYANDRGVEC